MAINITPIFRAFYQGDVAAAATCDVYRTGLTTRVTLYSDAGLNNTYHKSGNSRQRRQIRILHC
jgi:hypothetical protein